MFKLEIKNKIKFQHKKYLHLFLFLHNSTIITTPHRMEEKETVERNIEQLQLLKLKHINCCLLVYCDKHKKIKVHFAIFKQY